MSNERRLARAQQYRALRFWRQVRRRGKHRDGIGCMTCCSWLSETIDDEAERKKLYRDHAEICPSLMLTTLDLRGRGKSGHENVAR